MLDDAEWAVAMGLLTEVTAMIERLEDEDRALGRCAYCELKMPLMPDGRHDTSSSYGRPRPCTLAPRAT